MTPAAYVVLDEIPITAHGKIDRDALPEPQIAPSTEYRDPATVTERRIAALFSELLGHGRVGVDDSFFDLGGHSLVATKLVTAVRAECDVELGIRDIFELATVGRLAERVDQLRSGQVARSRPKLIATVHDEPLPLSASQLRTWFAYRGRGSQPGQQHSVRRDADRTVGRRGTDRRRRRHCRPARNPAHHVPRNRWRPLPGARPG